MTRSPRGTRPRACASPPSSACRNCDYGGGGCTVALRGGDRWTYVFGNVDEASHSDMLLEGASLYHQTADGLIPWRQRPEHFKRNCIARIPPLTPQTQEPAE